MVDESLEQIRINGNLKKLQPTPTKLTQALDKMTQKKKKSFDEPVDMVASVT
jgi:hypothetical protein